MSLQNILGRGNKIGWLAARQSRVTSGRANSPGQVWYGLGRFALQVYARLMLRLDVVWEAPLPNGPKIIAANHPTTTDPFFITLLISEQASILIHETLFKVPVFGRYLRRAGHVIVIPGNGRPAFEQARRLLEAGRTVVIFPEGGLSPLEGGLGKPCTGVARLSLMTGAPVIPVGIHLPREGIRLIETQVDGKPEVGRWYLRGPYALTVGKPMHFEGNVEDRAYVRSISESILQRIAFLAHQSSHRIRGLRPITPVPVTQPVGAAACPR
jgi:1-acyl-sn-glycerol-3-phosphate acyltransferase